MAIPLPVIEGFISSYHEHLDGIDFYHEATDFHQVISLQEVERLDRHMAWDMFREHLIHKLNYQRDTQFIRRYTGH